MIPKHTPPPWRNCARAAFASNISNSLPPRESNSLPSREPARSAPYVHWRDDPAHFVVHDAPHVTVACCHLQPNGGTMIHSHEINSVAISILDVSSLSMHNYNPPTYDETTKVCGSRDLEKGQILVQRPHGAGMPFVHQVFSYNDPLAFWLIEISLKALDGPAPRIRTPESPGVQTQHHPPSDFWSAVTLTLQPGAQICLSTESAVTPLVRSIHRIDDPLNDISVDVQGDVACVRRETQMWKWLMQAIVISNLQKNTLSLISNRGSRPWTGVVLDVFGKS